MGDLRTWTRRSFLRRSAAVAVGFTGMRHLVACADGAVEPGQNHKAYGHLKPDAEGILDLPEGFTYRIISRAGDLMQDDLLLPGKQDGMAAFPGPDGNTILVCNHEVDVGAFDLGPFGTQNELFGRVDAEALYDAGRESPCLGGTTTTVFDTRTGHVESRFLSLAGTIRNCAGGPTPWGSWITCEETVRKAGDYCAVDHGYNFEVPASELVALTPAVPLTGMGRFNHEAVCVDPRTGIVYQTEDRGDGLIYRYVPDHPGRGRLADGGRLQALAVIDRESLDTRNWVFRLVTTGQQLEVEWVDIDNVESPEDDLRHQGFARGAARFARGEGMWFGVGELYFACTSGGLAHKGQIWRYTPGPLEGTADEGKQPGMLELFIEPDNPDLVENADNLVVSPWGDLVLCEDGPAEQFLVGVTPQGSTYKLGRNALDGSEFAGATFSPDGSTLFVNIQHAGLTFAIVGPWLRDPKV